MVPIHTFNRLSRRVPSPPEGANRIKNWTMPGGSDMFLFVGGDGSMQAATILVVEDEPILGLELKEDLTSFGYSVPEVVSDGDSVMVAVLKHQPHLIIMDIKLHGYRDGIEAVHRLRAFYDTPVVYLSSHRQSDVSDRIAKTPNCRYLEKPYNKARLVSVIESSLSR